MKLRLCVIGCLSLTILISMYSLTFYGSPGIDPDLLLEGSTHTDHDHTNDESRHRLMTQDLLTKKSLHRMVQKTLMIEPPDMMQDDERETDEKPAPIEQTWNDKPSSIEQKGNDKSPSKEQKGNDKPSSIEQKGNDKSPPKEQTGKGTKKVLLFTYMRGGSTFLGSIFETHPEAIYWYEGLGPFYSQFLMETGSATYSVWFDVKDDHKLRTIVPDESVALAEYFDGMMNCHLDVMNPVAITHSFIPVSKSTKALRKCASHSSRCAGTKPEECTSISLNKRLANKCHVKLEAAHQCYLGHNDTHCRDPELKPYNDRLKCYTAAKQSSTCVRSFEKVCDTHRLRTTKVHRLSMQSVETIIQRIPDIYIVFYVRDPRGTFVSRIKNRGMPIGALCRQMEQDHQIYTKLKLKYPKSLHMMRYEDLAIQQEEALQDLFGFLDEPIPEATRKHMTSITSANSNGGRMGVKRSDSEKTANAWRQKIKKDIHEESKTECAKVLQLLGYEL